MTASIRNCRRMSRARAPTAMRRPISCVRSVTLTSMMFMMPTPPTKSEIAATMPRSEENVCVVAASVAWLGDVVIAEPKALIGFAGPRVSEQTIREKLPPGFQRSEFLLERGMIDAIVPRLQMRERLAQIISLLG